MRLLAAARRANADARSRHGRRNRRPDLHPLAERSRGLVCRCRGAVDMQMGGSPAVDARAAVRTSSAWRGSSPARTMKAISARSPRSTGVPPSLAQIPAARMALAEKLLQPDSSTTFSVNNGLQPAEIIPARPRRWLLLG